MIKHFFRKNGKKVMAVLLILLMWILGFYCAWKVQDIKIRQYRAVIIRIAILLESWEQKIEKLEEEKKEYEEEEKKIKEWNKFIED